MARFSKFKKRMESLLIPDIKLDFTKINTKSNEDGYVVFFTFLYKKQIVFRYPPLDGDNDPYYMCSPPIHQMLLYIDGYFALKHETAFNRTAQEMMDIVFTPLKDSWWAKDHPTPFFTNVLAYQLLLFLKVCDRRTGKRSLKKIHYNAWYVNPVLRQIILDRLGAGNSF